MKGGDGVRRYLEELKDFTKKCDWVLLILLVIVLLAGKVLLELLPLPL